MKAAVKKKKFKNKIKKKSLPNLFSGQGKSTFQVQEQIFPGPVKKIQTPEEKFPGQRFPGLGGWKLSGSGVPFPSVGNVLSVSANTPPCPPPPRHPALNDPEKRPLCDQGTPLRHRHLETATLSCARNCNSDAATRDRSSLSIFAFDH